MARQAGSLTSTLRLLDGKVMPMFGLGSYKADDQTAKVCSHALSHGYRLLDTATLYKNEKQVGQGLQQSGVRREDIFIVTKLWNHGRQAVNDELNASLSKLDMSYVDLYLIHHPCDGKIIESYDAMLELQKQGFIKSVGVSNFNVHHLEALREAGRPTPAVNQSELHPWKQQPQVVKYCRDHGIAVMGYSPLAKWKRAGDPTILKLAEKYNKSEAQILIRWSVQSGFITIPKTSSTERVEENANIFDFNLSEEDMNLINSLDENFNCTSSSIDVINTPWSD